MIFSQETCSFGSPHVPTVNGEGNLFGYKHLLFYREGVIIFLKLKTRYLILRDVVHMGKGYWLVGANMDGTCHYDDPGPVNPA